MPEGFLNPGGGSTPEIQRLHAAALSTTDVTQRAATFREVMAEVIEQAMDWVLYYPRSPVALSPQVLQFEPGLYDRPEFRSVAKS